MTRSASEPRATLSTAPSPPFPATEQSNELRYVSLFNGTNLDGWFVSPRAYGTLYPGGPHLTDVEPLFPTDYNVRAAEHPPLWTVEDGVLVGRQDAPGSGWGGSLLTEETFGDFELRLEMRPDWPADTGVMLRRRRDSWAGLQVVVDHRQSGAIGGFFGNGIGDFHAIPFTFTAELDGDGAPIGLRLEDPAESLEPFHEKKGQLLDYSISPDEFFEVWRWDDWNDLRVECVGVLPVVTTWIKGTKVASIDLARLEAPNFVAADIAAELGRAGHIALEVHENDPYLLEKRWGSAAACRWRNIRVREIRPTNR